MPLSETSILDALTVGVIVLDADRRIVRWNAWIAEASGLATADVVGRRLDEVFPESAQPPLREAIRDALGARLSTVLSHGLHPRLLPLAAKRPGTEGQAIDQSVLVRSIGREDAPHCLIQVTDISAAVRREQHLREMADYSRMLFDVGIDPLSTVDGEGRITDVNAAFAAATGRTRADLVGTRFSDCFTDADALAKATAAAWASGSESGVPLRVRRIDGACLDVLHNFTKFHVPGGRAGGLLASGRDITEQLKAARQLEILATTDSLTGLANRGHFFDLAEKERARSHRYRRSLSLFILDLDNFKGINDGHGHGAGDEVLRRVAEACRNAVRASDRLGRIGGEEMAILMPETGLDGAEILGDRLRAAIEELRISVRNATIRITASIGLAVLLPGETLEDFVTRADKALYEAKHRGRNRLVVDRRVEAVS